MTLEKSNRRNNFDFKWPQFKAAGLLLVLAVGVMIILSSGCTSLSGSQSKNAGEITLAPLSQMPDYVQTAPPNVQQAYRFAVANPEVLKYIPCYCGCVGMGHRHNLDCYVAAFKDNGQVAEFDDHASY